MKKWLRNLLCVLITVVMSIAPFAGKVFAASDYYPYAVADLIKYNGGSVGVTVPIGDNTANINVIYYEKDDSMNNIPDLFFVLTYKDDTLGNIYCMFKYDLTESNIVYERAYFSLRDYDYTASVPLKLSDTMDSYAETRAIGSFQNLLNYSQRDVMVNTHLWILLGGAEKAIRNTSNNNLGLADLGFTNFGSPSGQIFYDVAKNNYSYDAVNWAYTNNITKGIDKGAFGTNRDCTRGQIVQFIYNLYGNGEQAAASNFSDVRSSDYYYNAVNWAVAHGITSGTGNGHFSPSKTCTRAEAVTFLMRAVNGTTSGSGASTFADVNPSSYYYKSVSWAVDNGITAGTGNGRFSPNNSCTRGQIVTFMYRLAA